MENVEIDSAILLEGEIRRRVQEIVRGEVERAVVNLIGKVIQDEKERMMMEISIAVGKSLRLANEAGRKPLWESTPEEFGLTHEELNRSSIRRLDDVQNEINKQLKLQGV